MEIAIRHAQNSNAKRIISLNIVIGQLATIIDDSVQFYWDLIAEDTIAKGAQLNFNRVPTELLCQDCNRQFTPGVDDFTCPECQGVSVKIVAGNEFYLDSIEIE